MLEPDADLVRRSRAGDRAAFARLIELHQAPARRVAAAVLGSGSDADDIAQEAFVKAYTRLDQFDADRSFRGWLLAIVANEARNRRRADGRRAAMAVRVARDPGPGPGAPIDPADAAEQDERRHRLARAVEALDERDRDVVALRYFAELTEAETAAVLGCPIGTVKSRLSRALDRLRRALQEEVPT